MWAELGPAPKNKKNKNEKNRKCRNKNFACLRKNIFLSIYSLISGSGIKKEKKRKYIVFFFGSYEFLPMPELELFAIEYSLAPESGIL